MRSSIACVRCRRSKVKCVNNGVGTTCRACENSGRDCQYPSPVVTGARRRDSISARLDGTPGGGADAERRQRPRKSTHSFPANPLSGVRDSPRPHLDALDAVLLTPTVWEELFNIFQIHYSADLPFLHSPTFLRPLRQGSNVRPTQNFNSEPKPAAASVRPSASPEFLLAFLALTARFHEKLIEHHSPSTGSRPSNPLIASEYYATVAKERLTTAWMDNRHHDIELTQACLMLGLHEWGACRGAKAWLLVGVAIRSAQSMGLQYELDLDDEPLSRSVALSAEADYMGVGSSRKSSVELGKPQDDVFIQQEIRRRTFWSCYIMDRYLSSGKYRPQMLQAKELRIQLPASENSFMFAEKVRTLMLGEGDKSVYGNGRAEVQSQRQHSVLLSTGGTPERNMAPSPHGPKPMDSDEDKVKLETGRDEGLVSRYIKVLEIYGKVIKWSCSGGRRVEEHPPWDPRCTFYQLNQQCHEFKASLPRQHLLSHKNTQAHIGMKTSTPYTLVHTVYLLCQIILHREYVPFIPIRCSHPNGPLDAPTFPPDRYNVPHGFWEDSARECFKAAREIMNLVLSCQEWSVLVETPIVGFAIYTVAFNGIYCINFPWMDPQGFMCTSPPTTADKGSVARSGHSEGFEAARKALEMIGQMRKKLHMADGWFNTINRMHKYFRKLKRDYQKNVQNNEYSSGEGDSPESARHLSLREGGVSGGLDEFKLLERTLQDFGNLEDHDVEMADVPDTRPLDTLYDESSAENTVKSEDPEPRAEVRPPPNPENGSWSAINATPAATRAPATTTPSSGQFRSYEPYQPQQSTAQTADQQTYPQQLNNFRPVYSQDTPSAAGAPPSLTSPLSHSATTPSQQSPPFERPAGYGGWTSQNSSFTMQRGTAQQPPPPAFLNGVPMGQSAASASGPSPYPPPHTSPTVPSPISQSLNGMPAANSMAPWNAGNKESWLDSIDTRLGGDDIAAFVDGGELAEWASMAASQGFGGGWLSTVWGDGSLPNAIPAGNAPPQQPNGHTGVNHHPHHQQHSHHQPQQHSQHNGHHPTPATSHSQPTHQQHHQSHRASVNGQSFVDSGPQQTTR